MKTNKKKKKKKKNSKFCKILQILVPAKDQTGEVLPITVQRSKGRLKAVGSMFAEDVHLAGREQVMTQYTSYR